MKKTDFDQLILEKEIVLRPAKLIPTSKPGDEMTLTSIFLSSIRLIKEFKTLLMKPTDIRINGKIYVYTEVDFEQVSNGERIDGLLIVVRAGIIHEAVLFEMKNKNDEINKDQLMSYLNIAKEMGINNFITISNQFVLAPTQYPISIKLPRGINLYHFSWSYIITIAHILLFDNKTNIEDHDQVEIMKEVVEYFGNPISGICGFSQMKPGWKEVVERIISGTQLKSNDPDIIETVESWLQEEKDLVLQLSQALGLFVKSGETKFKNNYQARLDHDMKMLLKEKCLSSKLVIADAVSNLNVTAYLDKRSIEMSVYLNAPENKMNRGKLSWIKRQLDYSQKRNEEEFNKIKDDIRIGIFVKYYNAPIKIKIESIDDIVDELKNKEIKHFEIYYLKDLGKKFSSRRKFVEIIEDMLIDYYSIIVQNLKKWNKPSPKIIENRIVE
ncbi:MAG: hypothetical protein KAS53_00685 [Candidatus Cloacimonetes bacterium]|nr:hypothetical protein [Candidatus Cloacimonadota bacterium]